ncbi:hypothetical protein ACOSQ4_025105 [Xanthoceras sorbifolium]
MEWNYHAHFSAIVENWKQRCIDSVGTSDRDVYHLLSALKKLKPSLDRSLIGVSETCNDCYHSRCLRPTTVDTNHMELYICPYCQLLKGGSLSQDGGSPLRFGRKYSDNFCVGIEERSILQAAVDEALACKTFLTDILEFAFAYTDKDLSIVSNKLTTALKATEVVRVYDYQSNRALDLGLARHSWRVKVNKLLEGSTKPIIQQIQHYLKEGLAMNISPEDYFRQKLMELNQTGLQWIDQAKKVATDSGASSLDQVFELITKGESLPVYMEKELKITNFIVITFFSKILHLCSACKPESEELLSTAAMVDDECSSPKFVEPKAPSPRHTKLRKKEKKVVPRLTQKLLAFTNSSRIFNYSSGIDGLWH